MNSASLCSLAGRYDNPIPIRFLAPIDCLKIPAQKEKDHRCYRYTCIIQHRWTVPAITSYSCPLHTSPPPQGTLEHRVPTPPPLRVAKAGRNHLNEEITPLLPTGIGERYSQTISNQIKSLLSKVTLPTSATNTFFYSSGLFY
jgi:hypothetical protein